MLTTTTRRYVVATTVASFSVAALMGIAALLGSEFGDTQAQVLLTTLVVGVSSIAVLCYVATAETPYQWVGAAGCVAVLVPLVSALVLIWDDTVLGGDGEVLLETFGVGLVVAGTLAQVSLLLSFVTGAGWRRLLRTATIVVAVVLAVVISGLILGSGDAGDTIFRVIGVLAILDVFGTVIGGLSALVGGRPESTRDRTAPQAVPSASSPVVLPTELADRLAAYAARTGRSPSDVVAEALTAHLAGRAQSGT